MKRSTLQSLYNAGDVVQRLEHAVEDVFTPEEGYAAIDNAAETENY